MDNSQGLLHLSRRPACTTPKYDRALAGCGTLSDVLRHPPSSRVDFEPLQPVLQQYFPTLKFVQSPFLGEWFKFPHVELQQFLKYWTPI